MSVAEQHDQHAPDPFPVTVEAAGWIANLQQQDIPQTAFERAKHALLDWLGCAIAGQGEPLAGILRDELLNGSGSCTVVASGKRARLLDAALINGAASHALDYDDVNLRLHGHPWTAATR